MESSRRCDICNTDVHRESFAKHLRNTRHDENLKIVRSNFNYLNKQNRTKKIYNHNPESEQQEITALETSNEAHFYWKKYYQKNPLFFGHTQTMKLIMKSMILVRGKNNI